MEKIKYTFRSICDTIRNIKSEFAFYKGIWDEPKGNAAVKKAFFHILDLLKKVKPSRIKGEVVFGTGDPAVTGQVLGVIAALYGFFPEELHITPDFENQIYQGNIHMKGKLRLIHVAVAAIKLMADKDFRNVVKKVLAKEDGNNEQ